MQAFNLVTLVESCGGNAGGGPLADSRRTSRCFIGMRQIAGAGGYRYRRGRRWGQHRRARVSRALSLHLLSWNET